MIYPNCTGKAGEVLRLKTMESIWIQGKLRMWGKWSYIGAGKPGNMFNRLLSTEKVTKSAVKEAIRQLKKAGLDKGELALFFQEMLAGKQKSYLTYCTDEEALLIDNVIGRVLKDYPALMALVQKRYIGRGKSKREMAMALNERHPHWCLSTCKNRINQWLSMAEFMLYIPMSEALDVAAERIPVDV